MLNAIYHYYDAIGEINPLYFLYLFYFYFLSFYFVSIEKHKNQTSFLN
jgi:hypothetical protein